MKTDNITDRIYRIKNKIATKRISLDDCLNEREVENFESRYHIRLPEEYRRFLIEVGDGGDGPPAYGLASLSETSQTEGDLAFRPDLPFPLAAVWVWEDEITWSKELPKPLVPIYFHGHLYLGTDGCAMDWILVVTGPERGKVWNRADVGAQPCVPARDFLSWYEYWLDGGEDWYSFEEQSV